VGPAGWLSSVGSRYRLPRFRGIVDPVSLAEIARHGPGACHSRCRRACRLPRFRGIVDPVSACRLPRFRGIVDPVSTCRLPRFRGIVDPVSACRLPRFRGIVDPVSTCRLPRFRGIVDPVSACRLPRFRGIAREGHRPGIGGRGWRHLRFRGIVPRSRAGLASELRRGLIEHGPHQFGLVGVEDGLDLDHTILGVAAADVAALRVVVGARVLAMTLHERVPATQLLELRGGHEPRVLEQQGLVCRRCDAHHRAHLRVRHLAPSQGVFDRGKLGELAGDAHAVARGDQVPTDPPREPVRARHRALHVPPTALVELAQIGEQPVHGRIEVCRLFGDPFPQLIQLTVHAHSHISRL
jgi:hypothetical protein